MHKRTYQNTKTIEQVPVGYDPSLEAYLNKLRERRERECFSIVNRGKLWYDNLSTEQYVELKIWYQKWLDVTITHEIPEELTWINEKLEPEDIL